MTILDKWVKISLGGRVVSHYERLGYNIPRTKDSQYRLRVEKGTTLDVRVDDLPKTSQVTLTIMCDDCNKKLDRKYENITQSRKKNGGLDRCKSCASKLVFQGRIDSGEQIDWDNGNKVIDTIKEIGKNNSMKLTYKYVQDNNSKLYTAGIRYYGSWEKAVVRAEFNYKNIIKNSRKELTVSNTKYTKKYVKNKILKMREQDISLRKINIKKFDPPLWDAIYNRFGSYELAIDYCGLNLDKIKEENRQEVSNRMSGKNSPSWKGGVSPINNYLRSTLQDWYIASSRSCNRRCVISGVKEGRQTVIHHTYSFSLILEEVLNNTKVNLKEKLSDYTKKELKLITDETLRVHFKYPLGVILRKDIHVLFHQEYGYGNNTPEQFNQFKQKYSKEVLVAT